MTSVMFIKKMIFRNDEWEKMRRTRIFEYGNGEMRDKSILIDGV